MELKTYFAQDAQGNIIPGAAVSVFEADTETLASGLAGIDGSEIVNPFNAGSGGMIAFRAPNGSYDIRVSNGGSFTTIRAEFGSGGGGGSWGGEWNLLESTETPEIECVQLFDDDGTISGMLGKKHLVLDEETNIFTINADEGYGTYLRAQSNAANFNSLPEMQEGRTVTCQLKLLENQDWSSFVGLTIMSFNSDVSSACLVTVGVTVDEVGDLVPTYDVYGVGGTSGRVVGDKLYGTSYTGTAITVMINGTDGSVSWKVGDQEIPSSIAIPAGYRYSFAVTADAISETEGDYATGEIVVTGYRMDDNAPAGTYDYCGSPIKQTKAPEGAADGMCYLVTTESGTYGGTDVSAGDVVIFVNNTEEIVVIRRNSVTIGDVESLIAEALAGSAAVFTGNYNGDYPPSELGKEGDILIDRWNDETVRLYKKGSYGWGLWGMLKDSKIPLQNYTPAEFEESLLPLRMSEANIITNYGALGRLALSNEMRTATKEIKGEIDAGAYMAVGVETFTSDPAQTRVLGFTVELPRIHGTGTDEVAYVKCGIKGDGFGGGGFANIKLLSDGSIKATGSIDGSHSFDTIYPTSRTVDVLIIVTRMKTRIRINGTFVTTSSNLSSDGNNFTPFIEIVESGVIPGDCAGKAIKATMNVTLDDRGSVDPDVFGRTDRNEVPYFAAGTPVLMNGNGIVQGLRVKNGDIAMADGNGKLVKL